MAYRLTILIENMAAGNLTFSAQLKDATGTNVGGAITTGFSLISQWTDSNAVTRYNYELVIDAVPDTLTEGTCIITPSDASGVIESTISDSAADDSASTIDPSAYALTTLANQKRYLRIDDSDDDTLLTQLINAVSPEIERVCGVQFLARDRRERLNGAGQRRLKLRQWPVLDLRRLSWGWGAALTVHYAGAGVRAEVGVSALGVRVSSTSSAGAITTNNFLFADYPTVALLAAAIAGIAGWSASVSVNTASADLNPLGGTDAKAQAVILTYPDRADLRYTVDYASGLLEMVGCANGFEGSGISPLLGRRTGYEAAAVFPGSASGNGGHQYLLVEYRAGFETVPADVELMCNRLVGDAYNEGFAARGTGLASIGPFTWKASKEQVDSIEAQLAQYIDVSTFIASD